MAVSESAFEQIKFIFFIITTLLLAFVKNIYVLLAVLAISIFAILFRKKLIKNYFKLFWPLYLVSFVFIALSGYFSNVQEREILGLLSIYGLVSGLKVQLQVIVISTLAFFYKASTTYYKISQIFYIKKRNLKPLRLFSLAIILVFCFLKRARNAIAEYNICFSLRGKSKIRHPILYITRLFVYLLRDMIRFADDMSLSIENRLHW